MTKDAWANLLAWCKSQRESLQMQREMLRSGRFSVFENHESGQGTYRASTLLASTTTWMTWMGSSPRANESKSRSTGAAANARRSSASQEGCLGLSRPILQDRWPGSL